MGELSTSILRSSFTESLVELDKLSVGRTGMGAGHLVEVLIWHTGEERRWAGAVGSFRSGGVGGMLLVPGISLSVYVITGEVEGDSSAESGDDLRHRARRVLIFPAYLLLDDGYPLMLLPLSKLSSFS